MSVRDDLEDCELSAAVYNQCGYHRLTLLARAGISQLLDAAANLLGCSTDLGFLEDVVRDELVAHRKPAQCASGLRF